LAENFSALINEELQQVGSKEQKVCQDLEQESVQSSQEIHETRVSYENHQRVHYARKLRTVEEVNVRSLSPLNFKSKLK
jgi:hypothetical protein